MPIYGTKLPFNEYNISNVLDSAGVYALYRDSELTYYGSSEVSVRTRLQQHKSGASGPCTQWSSHFAVEHCSTPLARESDLLEEHRRMYGQLPLCNDRS